MTPVGYRRLQEELQSLKGMRPEISRAIEEARGHGDLSENADYDAAKEKSGLVEAKIRDVETKLANAEVIDITKLSDFSRVVFGLKVLVEDVDSGDERSFTIVGEDESDAPQGLISLASPLGRALIGKEVGEIVVVQLPGGKREYEIRDIARP
jgi:transcription elongation factor GreA